MRTCAHATKGRGLSDLLSSSTPLLWPWQQTRPPDRSFPGLLQVPDLEANSPFAAAAVGFGWVNFLWVSERNSLTGGPTASSACSSMQPHPLLKVIPCVIQGGGWGLFLPVQWAHLCYEALCTKEKKSSALLGPAVGCGCDSMSAFHRQVQTGPLWVFLFWEIPERRGVECQQGENFLGLLWLLIVYKQLKGSQEREQDGLVSFEWKILLKSLGSRETCQCWLTGISPQVNLPGKHPSAWTDTTKTWIVVSKCLLAFF